MEESRLGALVEIMNERWRMERWGTSLNLSTGFEDGKVGLALEWCTGVEDGRMEALVEMMREEWKMGARVPSFKWCTVL